MLRQEYALPRIVEAGQEAKESTVPYSQRRVLSRVDLFLCVDLRCHPYEWKEQYLNVPTIVLKYSEVRGAKFHESRLCSMLCNISAWNKDIVNLTKIVFK